MKPTYWHRKSSKRKLSRHSSDDEHSEDDSGFLKSSTIKAHDHHIYFYGAIDTESVLAFSNKLHTLTLTIQKLNPDMELKKFEIFVHIHSMGGDLYSGFALYDIARLSKIPVTGIVEGPVASAATIFLMGCSRRQMTPNSWMLIHQISSCFWGTMEEWKDESKNLKKFTHKIRSLYSKHSKLTAEKLNQVLTRDIWWSAKKCEKYGLIDEILQSKN